MFGGKQYVFCCYGFVIGQVYLFDIVFICMWCFDGGDVGIEDQVNVFFGYFIGEVDVQVGIYVV